MTIKVGFYKMDPREENRLRIVFKMVFKESCVQSKIEDASVAIVSVEGQEKDQDSHLVVNHFKRNYPDLPAIILSDTPVEINDMICLTRPCKMPQLLAAIKKNTNPDHSKKATFARRTAASLQEKATVKDGGRKNNRRVVNVSSDDVFYNPNSFLQGKVTKAIQKANQIKKSVFLRCWSHRWVVVSPSTGFLLENIKERQLANLGLINVDQDIIFSEESFTEKQMSAMAHTPVSEVKATPINKFIWDITVRTARGRVPVGTNLDMLYTLGRWPNLTRLAKIKNAMRISALWLDQKLSINQVARQLAIPNEDVHTYFSAASAIALLKPADDSTTSRAAVTNENNEPPKKGLFSAILRRLSGQSRRFAKH